MLRQTQDRHTHTHTLWQSTHSPSTRRGFQLEQAKRAKLKTRSSARQTIRRAAPSPLRMRMRMRMPASAS